MPLVLGAVEQKFAFIWVVVRTWRLLGRDGSEDNGAHRLQLRWREVEATEGQQFIWPGASHNRRLYVSSGCRDSCRQSDAGASIGGYQFDSGVF